RTNWFALPQKWLCRRLLALLYLGSSLVPDENFRLANVGAVNASLQALGQPADLRLAQDIHVGAGNLNGFECADEFAPLCIGVVGDAPGITGSQQSSFSAVGPQTVLLSGARIGVADLFQSVRQRS